MVMTGGSFIIVIPTLPYSMAMTQESIDWRYPLYTRPMFLALFLGISPPKKSWNMVLPCLHFRILKFHEISIDYFRFVKSSNLPRSGPGPFRMDTKNSPRLLSSILARMAHKCGCCLRLAKATEAPVGP